MHMLTFKYLQRKNHLEELCKFLSPFSVLLLAQLDFLMA